MNNKELNTAIFNQLADIAREVFNHVICAPGTYAVADIARAIHSVEGWQEVRKTDADGVTRSHRVPTVSRCWRSGFYWAEGYDPQADTHTVSVDSFTATVNGWGVWLVLAQAATAWEIPTAARPVFARKAESDTTAETVATFAVTRELRDLAAVPDPREKLSPVYTYIFIDTRRRAAVACNGYLLRVVELPDLTTTDPAAAGYLIAPALLKSGRGRVTITADGYAQNGDTLAPVGKGRFPDWARLVRNSLAEGYSDAARVELTPATWRDIKKTVKDFGTWAKEHKADTPRVTIAAQSYAEALTIYAALPDFGQARETAAALPTAARASFNVVLRADQFAKLADVSALYIVSNNAAIFATAPRGFYYFMPLLAEDGAKFYEPFRVAPAGESFDPLADFAETPQPDTIESVETIEAATVSETPAPQVAEVAAPAADIDTTDEPQAENVAEAIETPDPVSETPAEVIATTTDEPQANELAPAPVAAALLLLARADLRDACKVIATAKPDKATDRDHRAANEAHRLLTREGLTVTDYKVKTADGLTLARFMYSYGKKSRRTLCAPLLKVAAEFATAETLADEWADLLAAAAAEAIESESETPQVETITPAPAADTIESEADETPQADTIETPAAPVWALADELPTADGLTPDTVTVADLPPVFVAVSEAENERESRRALLLTIASRARRLAVAVAAVFVAALLLTLTPDRPTTGTAAPAADLLAPVTPDTLTVSAADAPRPADTIESESEPQADTLAVAVFEPVSVERAAAPAADRPTVRKRHHTRENKRESRTDLLAVAAPADTIASEADTLTVADLLTLTPDTLTREAVADSLAPAGRELLADSLTITTPADSLTADTVAVAPADTITTAAPAAGTPDTIERERESETPADVITTTDTTDTDPVSEAESEPQADPVTPSPAGPAGTPSTVAPVALVPYFIDPAKN